MLQSCMRTPRLRLHTKKRFYARMLLGLARPQLAGSVERTESLIASYTKARHAILVSMGRMAIYHGLNALERKGEIILSPINVPEVVSLIVRAGFTPVFCDIAPGTWNIDPVKAEALITERTVAIMATHFYGNMQTAFPLRDLCNRHGLRMVEDAAQAVGAWRDGRHAGTVGDFGILSFSYPKNVTAFYGGCVLTDDDGIAARVRASIRDLPPAPRKWLYRKALHCAILDAATSPPAFAFVSRLVQLGYRHDVKWIRRAVTQELNPTLLEEIPPEYLARITPQQAGVIASKWPDVDRDVRHRIRCAEIYYARLKDLQSLSCLRPDGVSHTFHYYPVQGKDKYAMQRHMIARGCDVAVQHAPNCADLPAYTAWRRDCPEARKACAGTLMLPTYRGFPEAQAQRYADTLREYLTS